MTATRPEKKTKIRSNSALVIKQSHINNSRFWKLTVRSIKLWDVVIIILALAFTGFSAFSVYIKSSNAPQVLIHGASQKWIFPLDAEETVAVRGPLGHTVIRIHNGQAWVESSPCDNKICVTAGHLNRQGEFAACLPNKVLLMIEGSANSGKPDDATR